MSKFTATNNDSSEGLELSRQIQPLLHGRGSLIQGIALGDLVAMWIVGHHPALRDDVLSDFVELVRALLPACEMQVFGETGHPGRRDLS